MITLGGLVALSVVVSDASGALTASTVSLSVTRPDGVVESPSVTSAATGVYVASYQPPLAGRYLVHWAAGGALLAAYDDVFEVDGATSAPLLGLADMKRHLNITKTTDDAEIYETGRAISDVIESYLGFPIRRRAVVEARMGGVPTIFLRKAPCACSVCAPYRLLTVSNVVEYGITLALGTDYVFDADTAALRRGPWGLGFAWFGYAANDVVITYAAGFTTTPPWARLAFLRALENVWQRSQQAPHPGLGQPSQAGSDWSPASAFALPYAVQSLLAPHRQDGF